MTRKERKRRIIRAWRTQLVFMFCCFLLTTFTFLFLNHGLSPFLNSLESISGIASDIDSKTSLAQNIVSSLFGCQSKMHDLASSLNLYQLCPDYFRSDVSRNVDLAQLNATLLSGLDQVDTFVRSYITGIAAALDGTQASTVTIENSIATVDNFQSIIKAFLAALNAVNILFFCGAFMARSSINDQIAQYFLAFMAVPIFCILVAASVIITCVFAGATLMNAGKTIISGTCLSYCFLLCLTFCCCRFLCGW